MKSAAFLREIASVILNHNKDHESLCVVFPNKRARLYLSRYLGELTTRPVWAPAYFTISELMEQISGCLMADRLTLLFSLYNAYIKVTGSTESFDTFYPYGETLISDFDEIDKYLVHTGDLYRNLSDLKNIDGKFNYLSEEQLEYLRKFWSTFTTGEPENGQKTFLNLWQSLADVYKEFRNDLNTKGLAYEGMIYRMAVEDSSLIGKFIDDKRFLIVGFNALSSSEEKLFTILQSAGKAEFYWDYDDSFLDPVHEAGTFIRQNLKKFGETQSLNHRHFENGKERVLFVPVYSNSGQALIIPELIEKMGIGDSTSLEKTAIVLADEGLLINVLHGIPEKVSDINVTMGYPLSDSAVFSLVDSLSELNRNSRVSASGDILWYFSDVMSVMNNPLLKNTYGTASENIRQFALEKHLVYINIPEVIPAMKVDPVFNSRLRSDTTQYMLDLISGLIRDLTTRPDKGAGDPVQMELLFGVFTVISRLNDILAEQQVKPATDTLFRLTRRLLRTTRIPFSGEPLAGLQILGILETRILDFDNVIVISANEGILPRTADRPSYIPYNLRAGYGLPTPEHHDAIYSYYFYRLIQRAGKIALVYDAGSGGLKTGERSRFLHQLVYDMKLNIEEIHVESTISGIPVKPVIIRKTSEVMDALSSYLDNPKKSLSPSAINEYLNCPVKFYFHYIAGLKQPEDVSEDVDARLFGNLIHNSLHKIYRSFGSETVTAEKIKKVLTDEEQLIKIIDQAFGEELFNDDEGKSGRKPDGYNLIVRQVILTYIRQFLKTEIKAVPFQVISLEEKHYMSLPIIADSIKKSLRTGGVIDRIDLKEGRIRILDYKTGEVKNRFLSVGSLFNENEKSRNDAVFQVLLYCLVYKKQNPGADIMPGLFFLRQCQQENFSEWINMDSRRLDDFGSVEDEFEQLLKSSLSQLFDREIPFRQTSVTKICGYCAYSGICRR